MTPTLVPSPLEPDPWGGLYDFLDPGRHERPEAQRDVVAEARCLEIRRKLACFFAARGCADADDLAVDTLLRVAGKCREVDCSAFPDRTGYFYGVARNVLHEWRRHASADAAGRQSFRLELLRLPVPDASAWAQKESVHRHLGACLSKLTERSRTLVLSYYAADRAAKIEHHRALAEQFGRSANSLRIEVHRIRKALRDCLFDRLRGSAPPPPGEAPGGASRQHGA